MSLSALYPCDRKVRAISTIVIYLSYCRGMRTCRAFCAMSRIRLLQPRGQLGRIVQAGSARKG
eukprot:6175835-Pleurochrysis_carterae.AAC.2